MVMSMFIFWWIAPAYTDIKFLIGDPDFKNTRIAFVALFLFGWLVVVAAAWVEINGKL
jgi:hypothetical protein